MTSAIAEAKAFEYIIALMDERCGVRLHDGKHSLIRSRLGKRMRHHGIETLEEYCDFLQNEGEHFDFMVNTALPAVVKTGRTFPSGAPRVRLARRSTAGRSFWPNISHWKTAGTGG